jgi:uroporphyrinogen-III synthase
VTSHRRSTDLITALQQRGAQVLHAPTFRSVPAAGDDRLIRATRAVIQAGPEDVLVTTAAGLPGMGRGGGRGRPRPAADRHPGPIPHPGPRTRGPRRCPRRGVIEAGMSAQDSTATLVDRVLTDGVAGRTIALQLHGFVDEQQLQRLRRHGARVVTVAPSRWTAPVDPRPVLRLITGIATHSLDAVTFTSAPAAQALLVAAQAARRHGELVGALRTG